MSLFSLIYISVARDENISLDELSELLIQSRNRNKEHHITGMLLFREGFFVQVLEGSKEDVLLIFESIQADNRHYDVSIISQNFILEREFASWSMGFKVVDDDTINSLEGFNSLSEKPSFNHSLRQEPFYAIKLMKYFSNI